MDNQQTPIVIIVEGDPESRTKVLASIHLLLRSLGVSPQLERSSRQAIIDASADNWTASSELSKLADRFQFALQGRDPQRATVPVGSSPDGVASGPAPKTDV